MQPAQSLSNPHMPTCLIVEDSVFDSERMRRVLARSHYGFTVEVATTLACARAALARGKAALILLDNNLPDGLGTNFALELSRDEHLSHIPVIMVSDWPSPFMWEKAAAAGVRYVLSKREFDTRYVHAALRDNRPLRAHVH
ncbi:response regulator [Sulfitobacter sp. JB4-11]|uniref:response regulator n=1 Tax=Sulfitobacter rhodophyticola TaxID=3238304 RepID=UPI003D815287